MERTAVTRNFPGVRLVQAAYHCRSLSLYTKLGFDSREPLSVFQGAALNLSVPGCVVRQACDDDLEECARLCIRVHGHDRTGEMRRASAGPRRGRRTRGAHHGLHFRRIAFFGHAVGETNDDLKALIGAAESFGGPGFLCSMMAA